MIKAEEQEENKKNKNLIKLEGVEGLWYEQPDIMSKYKRRSEDLEEMRASHFAKMMASGGKFSKTNYENEACPDEEIYEEHEKDQFLDKEDPNITKALRLK